MGHMVRMTSVLPPVMSISASRVLGASLTDTTARSARQPLCLKPTLVRPHCQSLAAYHAHVSQLQPYCKQDRFLPDFGQSSVCEYNLWHLDPIGRAISGSPSSQPQSPSTRRPPLAKRSVSTGSTAKRATGSSCRTSTR